MPSKAVNNIYYNKLPILDNAHILSLVELKELLTLEKERLMYSINQNGIGGVHIACRGMYQCRVNDLTDMMDAKDV